MASAVKRRLSAILAADVVGYSRLMGQDETGTLNALRGHRDDVLKPRIAEHGGRIVKLVGDGILAEFASAVEAVTCAIDVQLLMRRRNVAIDESRRIVFRIGINIGDVIIDGEDIYGDGVNVAARLEGLADPGGICLARNVRNQVRDKLPLTFEDRGETEVKNIARPIRVFSVVLDEQAEALVAAMASPPSPRPENRAFRRGLIPIGLAMAFVAGAFAAWHYWKPPAEPQATETEISLPDKPTIAVLPFANLSDDAVQEFFADGLTDDLITDLSKVSGLLVIARNSTFAYKDRKDDIRDIVRELGVRYVLEGSVRRSGKAVRINAQLVDGLTGDHLWAERYDRQYENIFAIQDEVIGGIVKALSVQLTDAEREDVAHLPTDNLEAYDYFLRGERLAYRADAASVTDALGLYQRAIALDPSFADAYAGYARVAVDLLHYGFLDRLPSAVARKQAYEAASRAVSLNPNLARSYSVLALLQMLDRQFDTAVASAKRAVDISPNSAEGYLNLAVVLTYAGHPQEAEKVMETVLRLNPKPPGYVHEYHALTLFLSGRYEEAQAILQLLPQETLSDLGTELEATTNARLGKADAAKRGVEAMMARWPQVSIAGIQLIFAHHARKEDLNARLDALRLAGLPQWPYGFEGDPALRLGDEEIDALIDGKTWIGERLGVGPFTAYLSADGQFVERAPNYQLSGKVWREGKRLCIRSEAMLLGRSLCGPVYRNASGTAEKQDEFTYLNPLRVNKFSVAK